MTDNIKQAEAAMERATQAVVAAKARHARAARRADATGDPLDDEASRTYGADYEDALRTQRHCAAADHDSPNHARTARRILRALRERSY